MFIGVMCLITLLFAPALARVCEARVWPIDPPATFVDLSYPEEALAVRLSGVVVLQVATDTTGRVLRATSLSGANLLANVALGNVRQWNFGVETGAGVVVYAFEIDAATCRDDRASLFRLVQPNLAVVTACGMSSRRNSRSWRHESLSFASLGTTPMYPEIGRRAGATGVVVLQMSFDRSGSAADVRLLTRPSMLSDVAVAHAKTWTIYSGTRRRGIVVYEFALDNRFCDRGDRTAFSYVAPDYLRLSGCAANEAGR
jgi:hypothetical protein